MTSSKRRRLRKLRRPILLKRAEKAFAKHQIYLFNYFGDQRTEEYEKYMEIMNQDKSLFPLVDSDASKIEGNWDATNKMSEEQVKNDPLYKTYVKPLVDSWLGVKPESSDVERSDNPETSDL